jgi:glycosidase
MTSSTIFRCIPPGDFVEFMDEARDRGIRVIVDLVVNHTSDQHTWFQAARRNDSRYRSYYVWRNDRPENTRDEVVFPGKQTGVWQFDRVAKAYYFHRFYSFQPDLNTANPAVRDEIKKVIRFWLNLGVSGFRVDAAPFVITEKGPAAEKQPHEAFPLLDEFRDFLSWERGDAILLAEANVAPDQIVNYFGQNGQRVHMVLNFYVNPHLFLALADESPDSVRTPMQWTADVNAGFSPAAKNALRRPVISKGAFDYKKVNAQAQRRDPGSLLNALERMIRTRKEYPEFGLGNYRILSSDQPEKVLAHACESENGDAVIAVHNFASVKVEVAIKLWNTGFDHLVYLFSESPNAPIHGSELQLSLPAFGFDWLRLKR